MNKTLKEIITATLAAGALALTASCVAVPVPEHHPHRHPPVIVVYEPAPVIIYRQPEYCHRHPHYVPNRAFQNPTYHGR